MIFVIALMWTYYRATTHTQRICIARHMLWPGVCLSVCHKSEFYGNGIMDRYTFFFGTTVHPALFCKGIPIFLKIRVLSYGTLSQTLNLTTDFLMFFWPPRHVDHRSCFQQISTVDVLFITPTATITTGPRTHIVWRATQVTVVGICSRLSSSVTLAYET